jgi:hypothetical protein
MKIKLITGFRKDQSYTIDGEEAHKAYYLFLNPDQRGIFNNGVALLGSHIQGIEPDYHATMGWNSTHILDSDDWNELRSKGIDKKLGGLLEKAKEVATNMAEVPRIFSQPLSRIEIPKNESVRISDGVKSLMDKFKA